MIKQLINEFVNPGSKYRGAPFWAWNGELEPEELRRQIRIMHRMGLGGFFMHSRVGLATAYLSPEWFECVKACIDEAEKLDMQAWLYDEDRWPSGSAGGLVTADPEFRAWKLICEELDEVTKVNPAAETLAFFLAEVDGKKVRNFERFDRVPAAIPAGRTLIHFYAEPEVLSPWYNGQTYLDTLNHDAVKKFIEVTHEAYLKEIGSEFGKRVPGIFTDEPNYGAVWQKLADHKYGSSWTVKLPEIFKARYGYDLLEHLPELFYYPDGNEAAKVKLNYIDCLTYLFVEAFSRQIGEWCAEHNLLSTGHLLEEDTLSSQTNMVGSCMRSYEYMQAPGIDLLTEHWRIYDTAKQLSSAARQFNCKWRLSETYGCTGWDFPFAGHKAVGDWQSALGINLRCQHLSWYTMEGEAKRDYPASIFYQSPWWREYRQVEDYFARINLALTKGREIRDVLVIHPVESAWTMIGKDWRKSREVVDLDGKFIELRDCLLGDNIDFDYGDEDILARHAAVEGTLFRVKEAEYKVVIVPEMLTVRNSTLQLLAEFAAQGGTVMFCGAPASRVDGEKSAAMESFARSCDNYLIGKELTAAAAALARRVSITDAGGEEIFNTLYHHREDDDNAYLFICNTGHESRPDFNRVDPTLALERTRAIPAMTVNIKTAKSGRVLEVDLATGETALINAERTAEGWRIKTGLPAIGSRLFLITSDPEALALPAAERLETVAETVLEAGKYDIFLSEDNVLPLAVAEAEIAGCAGAGPEYILTVDRQVRERLGLQPRGGQMMQPWAAKGRLSAQTVPVKLTYEFCCETVPSGAFYLALERPETFAISLNGHELMPDDDCGWWCDKSLRKLAVDPARLRSGRNELILTCEYSAAHPGLEYIYLLGNFGAEFNGLKQTLTAPVKTLKIGDWVNQGLPFYSGAAAYQCTVYHTRKPDERSFVRLPEYGGVCVKLRVNGSEAGVIAWPPNELDITDFLEPGNNDLTVEVFSSRRNSHGPLFGTEKWPHWTGPRNYQEFTGKFNLVPCGLLQPPRLVVKKVS
ncbi:MAG: glycosyl hydrolase [Victivallaceae bacterium]|nr:glycosyl hydrolase [Victivallaceae bacterium]